MPAHVLADLGLVDRGARSLEQCLHPLDQPPSHDQITSGHAQLQRLAKRRRLVSRRDAQESHVLHQALPDHRIRPEQSHAQCLPEEDLLVDRRLERRPELALGGLAPGLG
jgi:hypothetical protein